MSTASTANEAAPRCYGLSDGVLSYRHELAAHECSVIDAALSILGRYLRQPGKVLNNAAAVKEFVQLAIGSEAREVFAVLYLDAQHRLIALENHFRGTLTQTTVYPRELVEAAMRHNAAAVILAHNHPSGSVAPSPADLALTRHVRGVLALVEVRVLDHIIVSTGAALSMAEQDMEPFAMAPPAPALPVRPKRGRPRKNTDQASTV